MMKRVVITGMGCVTPIGNNKDAFIESLYKGEHGFGPLTLFEKKDLPVHYVAEVKDFKPKDYIDRKQVKRMDRATQFGVAASIMALQDATLTCENISERTGVIIGTGVGGIHSFYESTQAYLDQGYTYVNPLTVPKFIPNMIAGQVAITHQIHGHVSTVVNACAAGTHAIGDAYRLIKDGYQDVMLAGGADACITPVMLSGFINMQAHSTSDTLETACQPFDKDRTGFVLGEGAGVLVLESLEHALERNAKIYGEIVGYGITSDAYHMTSPDSEGKGAKRAVKSALEEARLKPDAIDYINAHGTGTIYNDRIEALVINEIFEQVVVNSTKSMTGHLMGAGGAVEAIATLAALNRQMVHGSKGIKTLDEACNLHVATKNEAVEIKYAISNSLGFGGHNGTLIFKKYGVE